MPLNRRSQLSVVEAVGYLAAVFTFHSSFADETLKLKADRFTASDDTASLPIESHVVSHTAHWHPFLARPGDTKPKKASRYLKLQAR